MFVARPFTFIEVTDYKGYKNIHCYEEITDVLIHPKRKVQSYLGIITFPCLFIFCLFRIAIFVFIVIFDLIISYFRESLSFVEILLRPGLNVAFYMRRIKY